MSDRVELYTDGACKSYDKKTGGYGGWAYVQLSGWPGGSVKVREEFGTEEGTTSNRMELTAILKGLLSLGQAEKEKEVVVYSDSAYAVNAFTQNWIDKWEREYYRTSKGKLANKDLWVPLIYIARQFPNLKFVHVKGHNGNKWNEEADTLAQDAADRLRLEKEPDYVEEKRRQNRVRNRRKGPMLINKTRFRKD